MTINSDITTDQRADEHMLGAVDAISEGATDRYQTALAFALSYVARMRNRKIAKQIERLSSEVVIDPAGILVTVLERKRAEALRVDEKISRLKHKSTITGARRWAWERAAKNMRILAEDASVAIAHIEERDVRFTKQLRVRNSFNPSDQRLGEIAERGNRSLRERSIDELAQFSE